MQDTNPAANGPPNSSFCWCHHTHEPTTKATYRVCFECGHVWTRWTLLRAYWRQSWQSRKALPLWPDQRSAWQRLRYHWHRATMRPSRIFFCQECIHDF